VKQGRAIADMRGKKMPGADPTEPMLLQAQVLIDPALDNPLEFNCAGIEPVAWNNLFRKGVTAGHWSALDNRDLVSRGRKIRGADQAIVTSTND
jgi:hypothetical protein